MEITSHSKFLTGWGIEMIARTAEELKAFHPMTMGVMHSGYIVERYPENKTIKFYFWIDEKSYKIPEDHLDG
jgi:hypothetical protein